VAKRFAVKKVAIVGAGWAGCAAAVQATRLGHNITLFEASHHPGGRARRILVDTQSPVRPEQVIGLERLRHAQPERFTQNACFDNGQHILIGAYTETLALMQSLGVDIEQSFVRTPLQLQDTQAKGLQLPGAALPPALSVALALALNSEWRWGERLKFLRIALGWQWRGFECPQDWSVERLCEDLPAKVMHSMIEPLCVSALNTPTQRASASVFLRVLKDAMFTVKGGSDLLIPKTDLSALLPEPALAWLQVQGAEIRLGERVTQIAFSEDKGWQVNEAGQFDAVILALPHKGAAQLIRGLNSPSSQEWLAREETLESEAIATVYVRADTAHGPASLPLPMLRLQGQPAQFVFDRGQLGNSLGTLALVASAPDDRWPNNEALTQAVLTQASQELSFLGINRLTHLQTVVEKRATFACTPGLLKPAIQVSPECAGLFACGDYLDGPYPATLEAAVRSGLATASLL
jgi:hydroxysqualene dehydroxylase